MVFLQHPRERRVAIGTCRMAQLALPNSELHVGVTFDGNARVRALAAAPRGRVALLYPNESAHDATALPSEAPETLIVVDGTWGQARKVLARNPILAALPRIGLKPSRPGNYRIRREPAPHCLATIEAVVDVLGRLEGDGARFTPMLRAFEQMVDTQLACVATRRRPYYHERKRRRRNRNGAVFAWAARRTDLVLVYGEANAYPGGRAELVQLVALRPSTGERFAALIAPRLPLAATTLYHLELPAERLVTGEPIGTALARWRTFLRPSDLLCAWGRHTIDLLRAESAPERPLVDLREAATRRLGRKSGGMEQAAALLGREAPPSWAAGRAGRRLAALAAVLEHL